MMPQFTPSRSSPRPRAAVLLQPYAGQQAYQRDGGNADNPALDVSSCVMEPSAETSVVYSTKGRGALFSFARQQYLQCKSGELLWFCRHYARREFEPEFWRQPGTVAGLGSCSFMWQDSELINMRRFACYINQPFHLLRASQQVGIFYQLHGCQCYRVFLLFYFITRLTVWESCEGHTCS